MSSSTDSELARDLVDGARKAVLSTLALRPAGYPFGSLVAIATDERGRPLLLLSQLAEHTKNLQACANASLLVADEAAADPLASPRVTLLGACTLVPAGEVEAVRTRYLAHHPEAETWAAFRDFAFYRLEPVDVRLVAGFGRMSWIDGEAFAHAR